MKRYGWNAYIKDILAPYLKMTFNEVWTLPIGFTFSEMQRMKKEDDVNWIEHKRRQSEIEKSYKK